MFSKKLELITNIAIVISALSFVLLVANKFWFNPDVKSKARNSDVSLVGSGLKLPDFVFRKEQTVLLVLNQHCKYCTQSMPFYEKVLSRADVNSRIEVIAIFPHSVADGRTYLESFGLHIEKVFEVPLEGLGTKGTPTLILVNEEGTVVKSWFGKLSETGETEVLSLL